MPKKKTHKTIIPQYHRQAEVVETIVDHPYFNKAYEGRKDNPRYAPAQRNIREHPVTYYAHNHHTKDKFTPDMVKAASIYRGNYERAMGNGVGAIDYSQPKVDGGGKSDNINDRRSDASKWINKVEKQLGPEAHDILHLVCGEGKFIGHLATKGRSQKRKMLQLCEALQALSHFLGLMQNDCRHGSRLRFTGDGR